MKPAFGIWGQKSVGVGLQYCGTTGQVQNCQVGVFLSYVTAKGHTLIDRELDLPLDWCEDRDRERSASASREEQAKPLSAREAEPDHPAASISAPSASLVDLLQRLSCLETKIATLQEQLAQLALALLQERERTVEQRIAALESLMQPLVEGHMLADPHEQGARQEPACVPHRGHQPLPVEQRARSRMPPLIEYGAQGTYVIISSQEGELHLAPDSAEWFEWLASISSFRFVGQQGRFTAYRHDRLSRSWRAHRVIHRHHCKLTLGVTDQLTIQRLEQVAATLPSHMASL